MSNATKYKNEWNAKKYDQVRLNVLKGQKAIIQAYAEAQGMSLNGYINKLIADDMGEALLTTPQTAAE